MAIIASIKFKLCFNWKYRSSLEEKNWILKTSFTVFMKRDPVYIDQLFWQEFKGEDYR